MRVLVQTIKMKALRLMRYIWQKSLIELLDSFKQQDFKLISLNENIDTTTATGDLAFHMIGAIAQFERRLISERTKAGLNAARARGLKGG